MVSLTRSPHSNLKSIAVLAIYALAFSLPLYSQTAAPASPALLPGPQPADVSVDWKSLVGIYAHEQASIILLERDRKLYLRAPDGSEHYLQQRAPDTFTYIVSAVGKKDVVWLHRDAGGGVSSLTLRDALYSRADAGSDPIHFFRVTPSQPIEVLRTEALRASPPDEPGPFRKPELVELATLDPAFHLDIRYAQSDNFLSTPVYSQARAFMQRPAAEALRRALHNLQALGYGLLIHDAYRPWYVTKIFWDATPPADHNFVADPQKGSKHNRGCAVDITLYDLATGKPIEMPGLYDEMSPRSFPNFPGGTSLQRWHRDLLRHAIESEGFTVDGNEWWHFDYKDWKQYPISNVPFENVVTTTTAK